MGELKMGKEEREGRKDTNDDTVVNSETSDNIVTQSKRPKKEVKIGGGPFLSS